MQYSYIWSEDKDNIIQSFVDSEPIIQEIKEKFMEYDSLVDEIQHLPKKHVVGPIEISMGSDLIYIYIYFLIYIDITVNCIKIK